MWLKKKSKANLFRQNLIYRKIFLFICFTNFKEVCNILQQNN